MGRVNIFSTLIVLFCLVPQVKADEFSTLDKIALNIAGTKDADTRKSDSTWKRLPFALELITSNDNQRREEASFSPVQSSPTFKGWLQAKNMQASDFDWLIVRNIDVAAGRVQTQGQLTLITVPLAYDLRYSARVPIGSSRVSQNGTFDVAAYLNIALDSAGRVLNVEVAAFDDSQMVERLQRKLTGIFDIGFIEAVSIPLLESTFAKNENLKQVLDAAGITSANGGPTLP